MQSENKKQTTCLHPLQLERAHQPSFVRAFNHYVVALLGLRRFNFKLRGHSWLPSLIFLRRFMFHHLFFDTFLFTFTPRYYFLVKLCCQYQENIRRHTHTQARNLPESSYRLTMLIAHRQQLKLFKIF